MCIVAVSSKLAVTVTVTVTVVIVVEEAHACSDSYQVRHARARARGTRATSREDRMLIGKIYMLARSVTSKKSCALDGNPSCERVRAGDESEGENI